MNINAFNHILLSEYIYIYLNPHFIDKETADQKAEVIYLRLPRI